MKCDNCGCQLAENQGTAVSRSLQMPTGSVSLPVLLCSRCNNPQALTRLWIGTLSFLAVLSVGLITLLGYLIS